MHLEHSSWPNKHAPERTSPRVSERAALAFGTGFTELNMSRNFVYVPTLTRKPDAFYACGTHECQRAGTMPGVCAQIRRVRLLLILPETFNA